MPRTDRLRIRATTRSPAWKTISLQPWLFPRTRLRSKSAPTPIRSNRKAKKSPSLTSARGSQRERRTTSRCSSGRRIIDILKKVNPKLTQIIDWGFFGILAKPLFLWLNYVKDHWTNNYGWAIILVTLIINLALFPFRLSSLKSARKMQKLQPQIQAINAKYKNVRHARSEEGRAEPGSHGAV